MPDKEYPSGPEHVVFETNEVNLSEMEWAARRPHTTLIHACYRVESYLSEFFATLEAQTADHRGYELIFVVDGSPDRSAELIRTWAASTDYAVRLIVQRNQGVAAARNAALAVARGAWVSSPDPDDQLAPNYLQLVEDARSEFPAEDMVVARIQLRSADGRDIPHPLDFKFADLTRRVIDLAATPELIQPQGGTVFMRLARIAADGLRFNTRLPAASDSDFIMRFLLLNGARYVYVPAARYDYQRRADDSSIVKTQEENVERYRVVFGETHPALLELAGTECPSWLANTLLYFVYYLFRRNRREDSPVYSTPEKTLRTLREDLTRNLIRIGGANIRAFRIFDVPLEIRMAWLAAAEGGISRSPVEVLQRAGDGSANRVAWYESLTDPVELDGAAGTRVCETKRRGVEFLGGHWVTQRIARVRADERGQVRLTPQGIGLELEPDGLARDPAEIRRELGQQRPPSVGRATGDLPDQRGRGERVRAALRPRKRVRRARLALALRMARVTGRTRRLAGAVVLTAAPGEGDRTLGALFEAAAAAQPDANLWFVADAGSESFARLRAAGAQIAQRGSAQHFVVLKCASRVWVPHATRAAWATSAPFGADVLARTWETGYLSIVPPSGRDFRRLNAVPAELLIAGSEDERSRLTADGGDYRFLPSEVALVPGWRTLIKETSPPTSAVIAVSLAAALVGSPTENGANVPR
ncbi:glycosyltransferase involved in cell wall biosynthesis [Leucobacter luti]|uniref:glycosyltransferase family 2 protein n=1 Tax=Leucobacter luti TaxID=340320 RepID=UPI00104DC518|nr:glycosyltransferase [Leucobacter luti]MCW2289850.1 glycosyltransferase involved in cell wall biosynthesis [Leucobacter luti]TCK36019.1 glycosyltransferase involved in cell wall biosynthesis [Leucobacter luti]